jgi:hypothetical protein
MEQMFLGPWAVLTLGLAAFPRFTHIEQRLRAPRSPARDEGGRVPMPWAKLDRMSEGFLFSCTVAIACAVRSHDQGAWVWRRGS